MAARRTRAVRVDPGATADRRASAGDVQDSVANAVTFPRQPFVGHPISIPSHELREGSLSRDDNVAVRGFPPDVYAIVNDLERYRGTLVILLFLYREGPATAYRMRQRLSPGPEAIRNCLNRLTTLRIVRPTRSPSFPFGRSYELTDLGKDLVESPVRAWPYVLLK
jgi:DNA-binding HxlR family transcriptional regulator